MMHRRLVLLAFAALLTSVLPAAAQDPVLEQMYGSGVHAFFSQEYPEAYDDFTTAIDAGSTDPRAYYYRGMAYLKLGRPEEAETDFQKGADLEAKDVNRFYNVGRALERVQGKDRMMLEKYRVKARMIAMQEAEKLRAARYEQMRREEDRVLQKQAATAPQAPPPVPATTGAPAGDIFSTGPVEVPSAPAAEPPPDALPPAPPATDPFATPPAAPADNPFAAPPAAPAEDPFATPPSAAPGDAGGGVLGAVGKALGKAVTGNQKPAAPAADNPFAAPAPATPAPTTPAPAAPADNPFAAPAPATPAPAAPADQPPAPAPAGNPPAPADQPPAPAPADQPPAPTDKPPAPAPADNPPAPADQPPAPAPAPAAPAPADQPPAPADKPPAPAGTPRAASGGSGSEAGAADLFADPFAK